MALNLFRKPTKKAQIMKQKQNTALMVSTEVGATVGPVVGQVLEGRVTHSYEFAGEVRQHWEVKLLAGRNQQQQMYPGTGGNWVDVGEPIVRTQEGSFGYDLPLNKNTSVQYVWLGA